jgi:hypothetical protein
MDNFGRRVMMGEPLGVRIEGQLGERDDEVGVLQALK